MRRNSSSDSLDSFGSSSLVPPMRPTRRGSNGSDSWNDDGSKSLEEHEPIKRGSNLTRSKSTSHGLPPSRGRGLPSRGTPSRRSSSPDRSNGLTRWKSTSECLRVSSIPEDSCLLSLTSKKHPADTDPSVDESPRMPGPPKRRSSFSNEDEPKMLIQGEEDDAEPVPPPPGKPMRRHKSEFVPRRGLLLEMQMSLESESTFSCQHHQQHHHQQHTTTSSTCGDSRPAPPRRAPSRTVSESVTPLQRSLSRHTSMMRRPREQEEEQENSPTLDGGGGGRPAPPRRGSIPYRLREGDALAALSVASHLHEASDAP